MQSPRRAGAPHRVGRAEGRRRQLVHRDRAVAARRRSRSAAASSTIDPDARARARRRRSRRGARRATHAAVDAALDAAARGRARRPRTSCPRRSRSPRRAGPSASGPARCARCSASTARRPASAAVAVQPGAEMRGGAGAGAGRSPTRPAARSGCSSASPASTATPTAPSRSRSRPATPGWRSSTRASGSRPAEIAAAARDEDVDVVGPLDPLRLPPGAGARDPARLRGGRGRTRRSWSAASSRTRTARSWRPWAWPGCTRRRTTGWPGSWRDIAELARIHRSRVLRPGRRPADEERPWRIRESSWSPYRAASPRSPPARSGVAIERARARGGCRRPPGWSPRSPASRSAREARQQRATSSEQAEDEIRAMRRELASINAVLQEEVEPPGRPKRSSARPSKSARERDEQAFDAATGLYDEQYFAVLVQQQVAAARRSLRPVSVIIFEIDAMGEADARHAPAGARCRRRRRAAHVARERRRVPARRPDGRRDPRGHARSRRGVGRRARARHVARDRRSATRSRCRPASRATRRTRWVRPSWCTRRAARSTKPGLAGRDRVELAPEPSS